MREKYVFTDIAFTVILTDALFSLHLFFFQACFLYVRAASMLNSRANPPSAA